MDVREWYLVPSLSLSRSCFIGGAYRIELAIRLAGNKCFHPSVMFQIFKRHHYSIVAGDGGESTESTVGGMGMNKHNRSTTSSPSS